MTSHKSGGGKKKRLLTRNAYNQFAEEPYLSDFLKIESFSTTFQIIIPLSPYKGNFVVSLYL